MNVTLELLDSEAFWRARLTDIDEKRTSRRAQDPIWLKAVLVSTRTQVTLHPSVSAIKVHFFTSFLFYFSDYSPFLDFILEVVLL